MVGEQMKSCQARFLAITAVVLIGTAPARANVEGVWLSKDGGTVRIQSCGNAMCGTIVSPSPSDAANPEIAKRSRPGTPVLRSMRPNGPNKWTGELYNVEDGKTYTGNLIEVGPDTIRVEGCVLFLCGGENLTRVKSTASSAR
jgi:uncharacterized protein (DUF2147 family)